MNTIIEQKIKEETNGTKEAISILIGYIEYLQSLDTYLEDKDDNQNAVLVRHNLQCLLTEFAFDHYDSEVIPKLKEFLTEIAPEVLDVSPSRKKTHFEFVYEKLWTRLNTGKSFQETLMHDFEYKPKKALDYFQRASSVKTELADLSRFTFMKKSQLSRVRTLFLEFAELASLVQKATSKEEMLDRFVWKEEKALYQKRFSRFIKPFVRKIIVFHESYLIKSLNLIFDLDGPFYDFEAQLTDYESGESDVLDLSLLSCDFPESCVVFDEG